MSNLIDRTIRLALRREPTAEDYREVHEMLSALPDEMHSSPGIISEIVLRMDYLRKLKAAIEEASRSAQQQIHADLPHRMEEAALKALNKMRTLMPTSAADATRGMLKTAAVLLTTMSFVSSMSGWILGQHFLRKQLIEGHQIAQSDRARCVDASIGQIATGQRSDVDANSKHLQMVRSHLLVCVDQLTGTLSTDP